jgi:hypothetical protein
MSKISHAKFHRVSVGVRSLAALLIMSWFGHVAVASEASTRPVAGTTFKLVSTITTDAGDELVGEIYFLHQFAVTFDESGRCDLLFDLKNPTWYDVQRRNKATLAECEEWAAVSKTKTLSGLADIPDAEKRAWIESSVRADFRVVERDGKIVFDNAILHAEVVPQKVEPAQLNQINMFRKLNAYYKGLTAGQSPFMDLRQADELIRRKVIPLKSVSRLVVDKKVVTTTINTSISALSQLEKAVVSRVIKEQTAPVNGEVKGDAGEVKAEPSRR